MVEPGDYQEGEARYSRLICPPLGDGSCEERHAREHVDEREGDTQSLGHGERRVLQGKGGVEAQPEQPQERSALQSRLLPDQVESRLCRAWKNDALEDLIATRR